MIGKYKALIQFPEQGFVGDKCKNTDIHKMLTLSLHSSHSNQNSAKNRIWSSINFWSKIGIYAEGRQGRFHADSQMEPQWYYIIEERLELLPFNGGHDDANENALI